MNADLLERILDTSRRMAETRALQPLLKYALDEIITLVGAESGYLALSQPDGSFDFRVVYPDLPENTNVADQISTSILKDVITSARPIVVRDAANDDKYKDARSVFHLKIRSVMCAPLIARGNVIGAIYVENRSVQGRFSEANLTPLLFLASQAAVSIENAALNEELEKRIAERTRELEEEKSNAEKSWQEAVEANRLRTALLGNVAHDLRVPLTVIVGTLAMLIDGDMGDLNEEQRYWITNSTNASRHILQLIDDLFDLTKLEQGGLTIYKEMLNLNSFLGSIYDVGRGLPWPSDVELRLDIPEHLPYVYIDPNRIRQVLLNLLSNALKFTQHGSVTLYAQTLSDPSHVLVGVIDTGEGIPQEHQDKLFKRFQQFDTNMDRRRSGTGLGLAISRELIEMHGGNIWVESTYGVGSDFKMLLPTNPS